MLDSPSSSVHSHSHDPGPLSAGEGKISTPRKSSSSTTPPSLLSLMGVPSAAMKAGPEVAVTVTQGLPMGILKGGEKFRLISNGLEEKIELEGYVRRYRLGQRCRWR